MTTKKKTKRATPWNPGDQIEILDIGQGAREGKGCEWTTLTIGEADHKGRLQLTFAGGDTAHLDYVVDALDRADVYWTFNMATRISHVITAYRRDGRETRCSVGALAKFMREMTNSNTPGQITAACKDAGFADTEIAAAIEAKP